MGMFEDSLDAGMKLTNLRMEVTGEPYEVASRNVRSGLSYYSGGVYYHDLPKGSTATPVAPDTPLPIEGVISAWMPEPDPHIHQAIAKLAEELAEAGARCARILASGYYTADPDTERPNWVELRDELSDISAAVEMGNALQLRGFLIDTERQAKKLKGFKRWHVLIDQELRKREEANNAGRGPG